LYRPKSIVSRFYKHPTDLLTNINTQVVQSIQYYEFKKGLNLRLLSIKPNRIKLLASYVAPNYLDSNNALIGDVFYFKSNWFNWELENIETTYVDITKDRNTAQDELEGIIETSGFVGLSALSEKKLLYKNSSLLQSMVNKPKDEVLKTTNDGKHHFVLSDKLTIDKKAELVIPNVIYGTWSDDNKTLIYLEEKNILLEKHYLLVAFNVETGGRKILIDKIGKDGLLGFITSGKVLAYSSTDSIGTINLETNEKKTILSFPNVGFSNDQVYVPNLEIVDEKTFIAEIYDPDYINNSEIHEWEIAWDGSYSSVINEDSR
jgi:hypothetical protein